MPPNPHDGDIVVKTNPLSDGPTIFYQDVIQTSFFRINKWEIAICCKRSRKRGRLLFFVFHRHVWIHDTSRPGSAGRGDLKTNWLLFSILRICIVERIQQRSFLIIMHLVRISSLSWAGIPRWLPPWHKFAFILGENTLISRKVSEHTKHSTALSPKRGWFQIFPWTLICV